MAMSAKDRGILRGLARHLAEIADMPVMAERREMWKKHNALQKTRPLILVFPEGSWRELLTGAAMTCETDEGRAYEWQLRARIYSFDNLHDDKPVDKEWIVGKAIHVGCWGLNAKWKPSPDPLGARTFDPVILSPADLEKLTPPEISHDEEATKRQFEYVQELFGDILDVRLKGLSHVSYHLMNHYTGLRGLEQVMMDMIECPEMVHEAMERLTLGYQKMLKQFIDLNLLSLNNDSTYQGTGGVGYIDELPAAGFNADRVRPIDMWASAEAQELTLVSPAMHGEFSLQYERRLLDPFALNAYGCCEDLTRKLDLVLSLPRIRRISIAPSANVDKCAATLGNRAIFSWKPQPAHLCGQFDAIMVRDYIKHTLDVTKGCTVEMVLKDTHTCENHPERFTMWTDIAQELVQEY